MALSLVGISCATAGGSGGLLGGRAAGRGARPSGGATAGPPVLVNEAKLGSLVVKKWKLPNGLQAILLPDPAATSVSFMTWYRVGSRHENSAAGETGLAHLFEHLMFTQTTSAREEGEFDRRMEEVGANANAMTYYDFTAYTDDVPPDALPLVATLEADRMANLALRDEQVVNERKVVAEERIGAVEDSVDGALDERMWSQAFARHPYRFPVIGLMKDIEAVTTDKAVRFYRTYYAPNNAVVVVTGRFEENAALATIVDRFGGLPASSLPEDELTPERAPGKEVRAEVERPVAADRLVIGLPAPALADRDRAAYELLAELLAGGPSSRLYRKLVVETELASSVDGHVATTKHPGLYAIWVQMTKGHAAEKAEAIITAELARLVEAPPSEAEIARGRARLETSFWQGLLSSEGRAEQLGEFEVVAGDYRVLFDRAAEYERLGAADLKRVAATYFAPGARSVVVARPGRR